MQVSALKVEKEKRLKSPSHSHSHEAWHPRSTPTSGAGSGASQGPLIQVIQLRKKNKDISTRTQISKKKKNERLSKEGLHRYQAPGPTKKRERKEKSRHQISRDESWNSDIRRRGMSRSIRLLGIRRFLRLFIT